MDYTEEELHEYMKAMGLLKTGDYKTALDIFRKFADGGHPQSQNNLGVMYQEGRGVTVDYSLAYMWYNLAASNGLADGKRSRDALAKKMPATQIAEAQKMTREWLEKHPQT